MERQTLSVEEAAEYLGIGRTTAYAAIRAGEIPHIRIRHRVLVPRAALERLVSQAAEATNETAEPSTTIRQLRRQERR